MTTRLPLYLGVAALLAAGAWMALRPPELPEYPAAAPATAAQDNRDPATGKLSASAVLSIDPRANPLRPGPATRPRATLFDELLAAKQYRAIYDRLKASAEGETAEGKLVLYEILRQCAAITDGRRPGFRPSPPKRADFIAGIVATDPSRERRIAAFDEFAADKCGGFADISITQADLGKLLGDAAAAGDPRAKALAVEQDLWQARRAGGRDAATISDAQIESLKQAAGSRDPEAIRVAGRVLANSWSDYALRIGPDQQPVEQRPFVNAWLVLACEYGAPCGPDTPRLQQACAFQGHCDAQSFPDYLYYYASTPHDSQLLVQYRAVVQQAIETGDWSQISVVRGQPPAGNRMTFVPGPR
ncbi:MAG: hypothetical protein ACXWHC_16670 [Usitatibacter sp.]